MQADKQIDAVRTIEAVKSEFGTVRECCRQYGDRHTRRFYRVMDGAGTCWGASKSQQMIGWLEEQGVLRFKTEEGVVND